MAGAILGDAAPLAAALTGHGARAVRRRYTRALVPVLVLAVGLALLNWGANWPVWPWRGAAVLVPIAVLIAADRARNLGHTLVNGFLVTRQGSLVRRRSALSGAGVVGWNIRQSFFQRRAGVATLTATTAAGKQSYQVLDVPLGDAVRLADQVIPGLLTPFLEQR